jgi:hypothetical protein
VVLDVDDRKGGLESLHELENEYKKLPTTTMVVTPGGGTHYYFRHPGQGEVHNTTDFPKPGLDIRGDGGYVLAPPSVGPNGRKYEFEDRSPRADLPKWLLHELEKHHEKVTKMLASDYAEMVRMGVSEGARNDSLTRLVGRLWHDMRPRSVGDQALLFELVHAVNLAKCRPSLPARDVKKIVESIARREARKATRAASG